MQGPHLLKLLDLLIEHLITENNLNNCCFFIPTHQPLKKIDNKFFASCSLEYYFSCSSHVSIKIQPIVCSAPFYFKWASFNKDLTQNA